MNFATEDQQVVMRGVMTLAGTKGVSEEILGRHLRRHGGGMPRNVLESVLLSLVDAGLVEESPHRGLFGTKKWRAVA